MIMVDINYDVADALGKKWDWKGLSTTLVAKGKGCTARLLGVQIPNWTHTLFPHAL
jgi:hypothetical protein